MREIADLFKSVMILIVICLIFAIFIKLNNKIDSPYNDRDKKIPVAFDDGFSYGELGATFDDTVVYRDNNINSELFGECYYALFINETDKYAYASKNAFKRMYPASMTKLMTAMVVLDKVNSKQISLDDVVTVSNYYDLSAEGGGVNQLGIGSEITVKDLLYTLLIQSNNYYALILADYVAGSESAFCDLMNEKAKSIGATNTNFVNPHGLDDVDHYTTAYDMYLIIKEAYSYSIINEIDSYETYNYVYTNSSGVPIEVDIAATNYFIAGLAKLPANYEIKVWKTGTTDGAGNALAMYLKKEDKEYVVVASCGESKPLLYDAIVTMLCLVN
ncbi:MAG: D-alanyl-D-alanine carboxypeptidase [Lachnospiraceae bacterium]|nr:D-alanyl-D-alanine carboxypeptidase [Lachnospiraceae bacterium]